MIFMLAGFHLAHASQQVMCVEMPQWNIGDTWTVRTWYAKVAIYSDKTRPMVNVRKGRTVQVSFEITGMKSVRDRECYEIRVAHPLGEDGFQIRYLLYVDKEKGNLLRIVDNALRPDGSSVHSIEDFPISPAEPILTTNVLSLIPFDFPLWSKAESRSSGKQHTIDVEISQEVTDATAENLREPKVQEVNDALKDKSRVVRMKRIRKNTTAGTEELESIQVWEPGCRWWTKALRIENGEMKNEAELIEYRPAAGEIYRP